MNECSGRLNLRLPVDLHARLTDLAEDNGISLNTLMVMLLAEGAARRPHFGRGAPREVTEALAEAVLDSVHTPTRNQQLIKRLDETRPEWRLWIPRRRLSGARSS
jgi:hypothetical protein